MSGPIAVQENGTNQATATGQKPEAPVAAAEQKPAEKQEPAKEQQAKPEEFNKEGLLKDLYNERNQRKALQAQVEQLNAKAADVAEAKKAQEAVQRKYDRLEAFLLKSASPLATALDSRAFTQQLFETDTPVEKIVEDWNKAHPSQTAQALGAGAAAEKQQSPSISQVLRAAIDAKR